MVRSEGGSLRFWGPGLLSTSPAFSMSSASHSAGSSGWLAQKTGAGPTFQWAGKVDAICRSRSNRAKRPRAGCILRSCGHIIDWVIVRPDDDIHRKSTVTDSLESDHYCTKSYFNISVSKPSTIYRTVRNIANIDRPSFIAELSTVSEFSSVENANQFCDFLRTVLDKHAPPSLRKVITHSSSPWFESIRDELFIAKRERRQAERKWKNTKLTIFKDLYRQAKHKVSKLVHTAKCKFYTERIALASSSKELYQIVNTLSNRHPPKILPAIYPSADLPSIFIKHFTNKVEKLRANIAAEHVTSTLVTGTTAATFSSFEKVSQLTVKECILNSAPKSCELDPIPSKLLIECPDSILPSLTDLFNSSLASGIFPQCFKSALVTPILKKRCLDHNDLNNYRPVSNLCFIGLYHHPDSNTLGL